MVRKSAIPHRQEMEETERKMLARVQGMIAWYERKAKRFKDLPLWEREARAPAKHSEGTREKTNVRRKAKPLWDDPPDIELALKHRDRVDRISDDLEKLQVRMDSGELEPKDYVNACMAYSRMEKSLIDHMREIRGCLESFSREQLYREGTMARLVMELSKLKVMDKHHRDRMEFEAGHSDLEMKTNAEIHAMIAQAESVTPAMPDVLEPHDSQPVVIEDADDEPIPPVPA